jgi:hypothetical protein
MIMRCGKPAATIGPAEKAADTQTLKELKVFLKATPRLDDDDKFAADVEDIITNQKTPAQVLLELSGSWEDDRTAEQIIADMKQSRK